MFASCTTLRDISQRVNRPDTNAGPFTLVAACPIPTLLLLKSIGGDCSESCRFVSRPCTELRQILAQ